MSKASSVLGWLVAMFGVWHHWLLPDVEFAIALAAGIGTICGMLGIAIVVMWE